MVINAEVAKLVQVTLRTFYEHKYVILIDQLVRKEAYVCSIGIGVG